MVFLAWAAHGGQGGEKTKTKTEAEAEVVAVVRTVHLRLPGLSPQVVLGLRRLYSEAVTVALRQLFLGGLVGAGREERGEACKQIYHKLRSTPPFSQLNSMLLDEAVKEAVERIRWIEQRLQVTERFHLLTPQQVASARRWLREERGISLPSQGGGPPRLLTPPPRRWGELASWPGWAPPGGWSQPLQVHLPGPRIMGKAWTPLSEPQSRGGWVRLPGPPRPRGAASSAASDAPNAASDALDVLPHPGRVRWQLGGRPLRLLLRALRSRGSRGGLRVGEPRLTLRWGAPHLSVPIIRQVEVPSWEGWEEPQHMDGVSVVGVDLGVNTLTACVAVSPGGAPRPAHTVSGRQFKSQLRRLFHLRRKAARRHAQTKVERIDKRIGRLTDHWAHTAARAVVDYALRQPGGPAKTVIVLENLASLRFARSRTPRMRRVTRFILSAWARGRLHRLIQHKASWHGIPVVTLTAKETEYTSKTCCKCGAVNRAFRWGRVFRCPRCGARIPRDVNAATVIAHRFLERLKRRRRQAKGD